MTLEHTSAITASSSRTSASLDGKGKRFQRHSWSRRSIKWSADDSSRNSRCSGRCAGPIFCCRPGRGSSTRIWTTYSAAGIRNSGRNHKRRSRAARRLDPRPSDALPSESDCKACLNFAIECITHLYFILQRTEVSYKQTPKVQTVSHQASRLKHSCWRPCLDAWSRPTRRSYIWNVLCTMAPPSVWRTERM